MVQTARRYIEIEVDAADALRTLRGIEDASRGTEQAITGLQRQFRALGDAFKGFLGFLGAQQLVGFADAATDIETRLLAVTATAQESEVVFQSLLDITGKLGVGINELARSYAQLAVALPERSTQDIILALDTVSTVLATTGASTQQVNAVLLQLNQALASATLQGDELRSVYENAPVLLKAWQEAADFTTQSIKELSAAGAFTTESFFELLPTIREISIEMIGMEQPALTIARAFEILTSNIIALLKDSESVSIVMGAVAQTIVLVAENLDLLVTAATAFIALKLPGYLKSIGVNMGLLRGDMEGVNLTQEAFNRATDIWQEFADILFGTRKLTFSMADAFEKLRAAVNSTTGRFIALFAVFESWSWAIDRINEAAGAMDRLRERTRATAVETGKFIQELRQIRELDIDTSSISEFEEGLKFSSNAVKQLTTELATVERELSGLVDRLGRVSIFTYLFDPEAAARAEFLSQRALLLQKQLESAQDAIYATSGALDILGDEAAGVVPTFEELTREFETFEKISKKITARRLKIEAEFDLIGLSDLEKARREVIELFDAPLRQVEQDIGRTLAQLDALDQARRQTQNAGDREKFVEEIGKQQTILDGLIETQLALQRVRGEERNVLLQQTEALFQATQQQEAMVAALKLTGKETENTFEIQFALEELYEKGVVTLEEYTDALGRLDAQARGVDLDALAKAQERATKDRARRLGELSDSLLAFQQSAREAEGALAAFRRGGEAGLAVYQRQTQLQQAFSEALRQQGVSYRQATQSQRNYAREATRALEEQLRAQDRLNRAQRESSAIIEARARIEEIGAGVTAQITDFGDISRIVDDITVQAVNGNQAAAEQLFSIAEENLRRLAGEVQGGFSERELERAKSELKAIAGLVFQEPQLPPGATVLDAEVAAAAELVVPTLSAPITFDQESLDQSMQDLQTQLSSQVFTFQVEPEIVGLAIDDAIGQTVDQEGIAGAAPTS